AVGCRAVATGPDAQLPGDATRPPDAAGTGGSGGGVDAAIDSSQCGAGGNVGTIGTGNAVVHLAVYQGRGTISVFRNGQLAGETSGSGDFRFNINDSFGFSAAPCPGFVFQKFCGDVPACSLSTMSNPFSGTITAADGLVDAVFQ